MRRSLLHILDCPHCLAGAGLDLVVVLREEDDDIEDALLQCASCGRGYVVRGGIPDLVRDALRDTEAEGEWVREHSHRLPSSLKLPVSEPSEGDRRIIDEGLHWGLFMKRFWDVGDRSIFDVRVRGTHPPMYVAGCLERDTRDTTRRFGWWPDHLSAVVFPWLGEYANSWGVDVGCGGGQMGLEAARQGVRMVGFDPSRLEIELALRHARDESVAIDYVRAEPANPPFRRGVFSLMVVKDALHHVPDLPKAMGRLVAMLRPGAEISVYEHVGKSRLKRAIMNRVVPGLVRKIRSRYPSVPVPAELLRDSANEDVSMEEVEPLVREYFATVAERREIFLYFELEMMVDLAYGKRRWFTEGVARGLFLFEELARVLGARHEHWAFRGRLRDSG